MVTINDKWIRASIAGIYLVIAVGYTLLLEKQMDFSGWMLVGVRVGSLALFLYLNKLLVLHRLRYAPAGISRASRFFQALPLGILVNTLLMLLSLSLDNYFNIGDWSPISTGGIQVYFNQQPVQMGAIISAVFKSSVIYTVFYFIYESLYNYLLYRKTQQQQEQLEKEKLQSMLDSLKQQINPHFLFNSLNSLSSLIVTNPEKAEEFVEELSRVYRYLLQTNDGPLTTLQQEVNFIHSYLMLLKTRFGEGLQVDIRIDRKYMDYLIPPMSLQLLVENAVKHNITDIEKPLILDMYTREDKLVVSNNVQKKTLITPSTGLGLKNIKLKYHLLNYPQVAIGEKDLQFTVALPLIAPNVKIGTYENSDHRR